SLDALWICVTPPIIDADVVPIPPAEVLKLLLKYDDALANISIAFSDRHQDSQAAHSVGRLLRARREGPSGRRAAEKRNELAPSHYRHPPEGQDKASYQSAAVAGKGSAWGWAHVRFGSLADICAAKRYVRFTPDCDRKSRHRLIGRLLLSSATEEYDPCKAMRTYPNPQLNEPLGT